MGQSRLNQDASFGNKGTHIENSRRNCFVVVTFLHENVVVFDKIYLLRDKGEIEKCRRQNVTKVNFYDTFTEEN